MPSTYLQPNEYAAFGVPNATLSQVQTASILIDAHLKRTEGLVCLPDSAGNPSYMAAVSPSVTLTAAADIEPGENVKVFVTGGIQAINVGDALILDRSNQSISEVVVVSSTSVSSIPGPSGPPFIILQGVSNVHNGPCTLEQGLTLKQHKYMPQGRPITTLAYTPILRLLSGQGRYGYGRRGESSRYQVDDFNLLASLSAFGGPPAWEFFPLNSTGIDAQSGQVWVPAGVMLAYYSEVNLWYVAGFSQENLPDQVKAACAQIITARANLPEMGDIKSFQAGGSRFQMLASSVLSDDSKINLRQFTANLYN